MEIRRKKLASIILTSTILLLLYLSGPGSAINVNIQDIADIFQGQRVEINATVTIDNYEYIQSGGAVKLNITTVSNGTIICTLPLTGTGASFVDVACTGNQNMRVKVTPSGNWGYGYGYGYDGYNYGYNYGYGYRYAYDYTYRYGYGYDYNYIWKSSEISYTIRWDVPATFGEGTYTAIVSVYNTDGRMVPDATNAQTFNVNALTTLPRDVRISEVMPNPVGNDDAAMPGGEWVELKNVGGTATDVAGWTLTEASGGKLIVSASKTTVNSTLIAAGGYLAVYRDGDSNFSLNNDTDTITLKQNDTNNTIQDVFAYDASLFNKSSFGDGEVIVITSANESACTGRFIGGTCYDVTTQSTPGAPNPGETATTNISLPVNWNLISIPVTPTNASVTAVLDTINGSYEIIWKYNNNGTWEKWYAPGQPGNTLDTLSEKDGYWAKMTANDTLYVNGTTPGITDIEMPTGWNLIGYPSATADKATETALASINGSYEVIWKYYNDGTWQWYAPGQPGNTLENLTSKYGYWVKMTANDTLTIS